MSEASNVVDLPQPIRYSAAIHIGVEVQQPCTDLLVLGGRLLAMSAGLEDWARFSAQETAKEIRAKIGRLERVATALDAVGDDLWREVTDSEWQELRGAVKREAVDV